MPVTGPDLRRNPQLYQLYSVLFSLMCWLPVFAIYIAGKVGLEGLLLLESLYYISVVIMEVPSGYLSDRLGRRPVLLISTAGFSLAALLFMLGDSIAAFAIAQVLTAIGYSFNSGSDVSIHYDSLQQLGEQERFGALEAVAERNRFMAGGLASLAGGLVGVLDLRLAYLLTALANIANLFVVLRMREPAQSKERESFRQSLQYCIGRLRIPSMAWLAGFFVLMTVLNHIPYEFYQPWLHLLAVDGLYPERFTPLASGLLMGSAMLVGSWFAANSIRLRDRTGIAAALLIACAMQCLVIGVMGLWLHVAIIGVILLRSVPRGIMMPAFNAAVAPQLDQQHRATYLSVMSLGGRLAFSLTLFGLSFAVGEAQDWPSLSRLLLIGAAIGVSGLVVLLATARKARLQELRPKA
ncbi:MFS transporter [bacterium]|nr:MFS transporter [bacterium]